jgi:hypothetical protein
VRDAGSTDFALNLARVGSPLMISLAPKPRQVPVPEFRDETEAGGGVRAGKRPAHRRTRPLRPAPVVEHLHAQNASPCSPSPALRVTALRENQSSPAAIPAPWSTATRADERSHAQAIARPMRGGRLIRASVRKHSRAICRLPSALVSARRGIVGLRADRRVLTSKRVRTRTTPRAAKQSSGRRHRPRPLALQRESDAAGRRACEGDSRTPAGGVEGKPRQARARTSSLRTG